MVGPEHIGRPVRVKADGDFFAFIDGWELTLTGFESGHGVCTRQSPEFPETSQLFYVPPDQLEPIE